MHILAIVICFVGLIVLSASGERGALRQLMYLVMGAIGALVIGGAVLALLVG